MQISIEDIKERKDPYQLFLDSIKNEETKRKYKKAHPPKSEQYKQKWYWDNPASP